MIGVWRWQEKDLPAIRHDQKEDVKKNCTFVKVFWRSPYKTAVEPKHIREEHKKAQQSKLECKTQRDSPNTTTQRYLEAEICAAGVSTNLQVGVTVLRRTKDAGGTWYCSWAPLICFRSTVQKIPRPLNGWRHLSSPSKENAAMTRAVETAVRTTKKKRLPGRKTAKPRLSLLPVGTNPESLTEVPDDPASQTPSQCALVKPAESQGPRPDRRCSSAARTEWSQLSGYERLSDILEKAISTSAVSHARRKEGCYKSLSKEFRPSEGAGTLIRNLNKLLQGAQSEMTLFLLQLRFTKGMAWWG